MDSDLLCLTDLERAYAFPFNLVWMVNFFLSEESLPIVKKADNSYWLQYYLMAKRKLVTLLLTLAEKSVMTATAESWGRKSWNVLLIEKWKQEKSNYVLLRAREKIAVNLYFIYISLLGKIYSNTSTQYAGCQVPALFKDGANHGTKKAVPPWRSCSSIQTFRMTY